MVLAFRLAFVVVKAAIVVMFAVNGDATAALVTAAVAPVSFALIR